MQYLISQERSRVSFSLKAWMPLTHGSPFNSHSPILKGNSYTSYYEYQILCKIPSSLAAGTSWGLICGDKVSTQQCEHLSSGSRHMHQPNGAPDMGSGDWVEQNFLMVVACSFFPKETCTIRVSLRRTKISRFLKFIYMIKLLNWFCALGNKKLVRETKKSPFKKTMDHARENES